MADNVTIKIRGLAELERKLDANLLYQPEIDHVREALVTRIQRPRKTRGFLNNPLMVQVSPLQQSGIVTLATVGSSLNSPRTTGKSWLQFIHSLVKGGFMRNQMAAAARKIEARWSA